MYYLQSRYYDPAICRFINADDISNLSANGDFASYNLYVYCGNNPAARKDDGGKFWSLVIKAGVGVLSQYASDVIGNIIAGKTGAEILQPTSSFGTYIAAGVTASIPGSGFGGSLVRNMIGEAITNFEKVVLNEEVNVLDSLGKIVFSSAFDAGTQKVSSFVSSIIRSLGSRNYSQHAGKLYKKNPNIPKADIYKSMRRTNKAVRLLDTATSHALDFGYGIGKNLLEWGTDQCIQHVESFFG